MSDLEDSSLHTGVRTAFMPWKTVDMADGEYRDLDRQGLIVHDEPAAPTEPPTEAADEKPTTPKPRRQAEDATLPASD